MRFGINLRSDLAKLSDAGLAAELDRLCEYRKARFASTPRVGSPKGMIWYGPEWPFGRGPIHARWAYKIWIWYFWPFRGPRGTLYLVECEIKDRRDEIQHRASTRKVAPWALRWPASRTSPASISRPRCHSRRRPALPGSRRKASR